MERDNFYHWSLLPLRELWRVLRVEMPRLSDPVKWCWWKHHCGRWVMSETHGLGSAVLLLCCVQVPSCIRYT